MRKEYSLCINRLLSYEEIEQAVGDQIWEDDDENVVKFAALFFISTRLLRVDNKIKVLDCFLYLADNLVDTYEGW